MARTKRVVYAGVPYHITHRGNNRETIFRSDADYLRYLVLLKEKADQHGLVLYGYCLMPNHIHLVGRPRESESLAKAVGQAHNKYSRYVNRTYDRTGHLWENRFYCCGLDEEHLREALCYVDRNPVAAKLIDYAWRYSWSSATYHVSPDKTDRLIDGQWWKTYFQPLSWKQRLMRAQDEDVIARIREYTMKGKMFGKPPEE